MKIADFLQNLSKVKRNGDGWTAKCPAHEDNSPSLSIKEVDGKILVKCFSGCSAENVCAALGLEVKNLFTTTNGFYSKNFRPKKIVAVYPYTDERGELLYENVRFEPKDFRQRQFDAHGKEIWKLKDVRRVPYRLPELIESVKEAAEIWLCEGEKDADRLRKLGFTVSSFKNWKVEFNEFVKNSDVVLFIDHDRAGIKQAHDAAKILSGSVASVKMIDLSSNEPLPDKHGADVSDFINLCIKGEDLSAEEISERLCIFADHADVWQPAQENKIIAAGTNGFKSLFTIQDANLWLKNAKLRPVPKMLFGEFFFEGELCIMFADTGIGKSILAVQIGNSVSKGVSIGVFTLETLKQKVLYFDFELSDKQFEARYSTRDGDYFTNHYVFDENFKRGEINQESFVPDGFKDFEEYLFKSLEHEIVRTGAKVLIVDNITYLKNATETAKDALPLMKALIRLKKKYGLSILALAHTPKRDLSKPLTVNDLHTSLLRQMHQAFLRMVAFYKSPRGGSLSTEEARANAFHVCENPEEAKELLQTLMSLPVERLSFVDLMQLQEIAPRVAERLWEKTKREARKEFESGHLAANINFPEGYMKEMWNIARYIGVRESFIDDWNPQGGIEVALIDMMTQCWFQWQFWLEQTVKRSQTSEREMNPEYAKWLERRRAEYKANGWADGYWDRPYVSEQQAIEHAVQMADRFNRIFLRTLRQLRDLRRYAPVTINNPNQVNIANDGGQQVNVSASEEDKTGKTIP